MSEPTPRPKGLNNLENDLLRLSALLADEVQAVMDPAAADLLRIRLALVCWLGFGDTEAAHKYLEECEQQIADVALLRWAVSCGQPEPRAMRALLSTQVSEGVMVPVPFVWERVAEALLWHWWEPAESADAARRTLNADEPPMSAEELVALDLELLGDLDTLASHLSRHPSPTNLVRLSSILGDYQGRAKEAAEILAQLLETEHEAYAIERLLEDAAHHAARVLPKGMSRESLLRRKVDRLGDTSPDRSATAYLLADLLAASGELTAADEILAGLATDHGHWAAALVLLKRRDLAAARGDLSRLVEVYDELASISTDAVWSPTLRYRAAELLSQDTESALQAANLAMQTAPTDPKAATLAVRLLAGLRDHTRLSAVLEDVGRRRGQRHMLRWASRLVEWQEGDVAKALVLLEAAVAAKPGPADLVDLLRLVVASKKWDKAWTIADQLARAYQEADHQWARAWASVSWLAAGLTALRAGASAQAERALSNASRADPTDVVSVMATAIFRDRLGRWREAVGTLEEAVDKFRNPQVQVLTLRNIARISSERLDDPKRSAAAIRRALEITPEDPALMHELATYEAQLGHDDEAVRLLHQAAELLGDSFRAAAIWAELGKLHASRGQTEEAIAAFTRALDIDEHQPEIIHRLCDIYREQHRWVELVETLEVAIEAEAGDPAELHVEVANILHQHGLDPVRALDHYRMALASRGGDEAALAGLEQLCRKHGWWSEMAEILEDQPMTAKTIQARAYALERLARWEDLRDLLLAAIRQEEDPKIVSQLALQLASLYEDRLEDPDEAARWYHKAFDLYPADLKVTRAFEAFLERQGRWEELVQVLEREIQALRDVPERRALAHLRLGYVLADNLGRLEEASAHLETCLQDLPEHRDAYQKLLEIYEQLGDRERLLDLLDRMVAITEDVPTKVSLLLQAGALWEEAGSLDNALDIYMQAFFLQPDNHQAFTAAERLCYKLHRWKDTERIYDTAIKLVEEEGVPAYRLADLYTRKGQLLFKYLSQPGEAAATYKKVLVLAPEDDRALRFLESICASENDWQGLLEAYELRLEHLTDERHIVETLRRAARVASSKLGDRRRAMSYYERLVEIAPGDEEALDALERAYERERQWEDLARILKLKLEHATDPDIRIGLLLRLGLIYEEGLQNAEDAIAAYKEVLSLDPKNRQALSALARIYEATERWAEFMDVARKQIRVTVDRNEKSLLYFKCGSVMEAKFGKEDDAIRYYKAAIKTSPTCLPAVHGLRDLYIRRKDWERVLETLQLEVRLWHEPKERAGVLAQIGRIYLEQLGDPEKAKANFEAALKLDPDSGAAARALFDMAFQAGDWKQAANLAAQLGKKAAREGDPAERSEFLRKRGLVAAYTGYQSAAVENFLAAIELNPNNIAALDDLIDVISETTQAVSLEDVIAEVESRQGPKPSDAFLARLQILRAMAAERTYDLESAENLYRQAGELDSRSLRVLLPLVRFLVRLRRGEEAVAELEEFVHRKGVRTQDRVNALLEAASIVSEAIMDTRRAEKLCLRALRLDQRNRRTIYALVQELVVQKRYLEARQRCQELIDIAAAPENTAPAEELGLYYYYLGRINEAMGDESKAALSYRRAMDLNPSYPPPVIALAKRYFRQGKLSQAESVLSLAARQLSESGHEENALELRRALARLHMDAGKLESARAEMRSIVATDMATDDDRLALASLHLDVDEDTEQASEQVLEVLRRDPTNVLAVHLMLRTARTARDEALERRAWRVLEVLGRADGQPPSAAQAWSPPVPMAGARLAEDLVREVSAPMREHFGQMYAVVRTALHAAYPITEIGKDLVPYLEWPDETAQQEVAWLAEAYDMPGRVDVFSGREVRHRLVLLEKGDRAQLVVDEELLQHDPERRRYVLAKGLAYYKLGASLLWNLGPKERNEVGALLQGMALPPEERNPAVLQFLQSLPRKQYRAAERIAQAAGEFMLEADPRAWMRTVDLAASQLALSFLDDLLHALEGLAWLQQEDQILGARQTLAYVYSVPDGRGLIPYYLSQLHGRLVASLAKPTRPPTG